MHHLITVKRAAKMRGVHPDTIKRMVKRGVLPDRRLPGERKLIFLESDLLPASNGNGK